MDNNPKGMASDAGGVALPQGDRAVASGADAVSALRASVPSALYTHHHHGWKRHEEADASEGSLLSALLQTHGFLAEYDGKFLVEVKQTPAYSFDGVVTVVWDADEPKSFVFGAPRHRGDIWFRAFEYNVAAADACRYCGGTGVDHYIGPLFHCWACDGFFTNEEKDARGSDDAYEFTEYASEEEASAALKGPTP